MRDDWCIDYNPAFKLFISDVVKCKNISEQWTIDFGNESQLRTVSSLQIQGVITKITGYNNEIMIVDDGTGKAKITRGPKVPGDFSWLQEGALCSVVGVIQDGGKLPHINAIKVTKVNDDIQKEMWPLEVKELRNFLSGLVAPSLEGTRC